MFLPRSRFGGNIDALFLGLDLGVQVTGHIGKRSPGGMKIVNNFRNIGEFLSFQKTTFVFIFNSFVFS